MIPRGFNDQGSEQATAYNPGLGAQQNALRGMEEASQTGFTGLDRMAQVRAQQQAQRGNQSQQAGIVQQAQMRGQGGPVAFAAAQSAQQGNANQANAMGATLGMQGQQRQLMANQALGQAGNAMQADAMQRAGANDAFAQWQAQQNAATLAGNYDYKRTRNQQNKQEKQNFWDNVGGMFGG
jgi:hypothetical protein